MLEYSNKGAEIEVDKLEEYLLIDKFQYSLEDFLFLYLTSGFLVSCSPTALDEIKDYAKLSQMQCYKLGRVTVTHESNEFNDILLKYRDEEKIMISFKKRGKERG
jgi:selenophosphate synthetase-related protein